MSFAKLQKKYSGMYVLTDKPEGKVVAASKDLKKAFKDAEKKGYQLPAAQFIEPKNTVHIYLSFPKVGNPPETTLLIA